MFLDLLGFALLSWIPVGDVARYFKEKWEQDDKYFNDDKNREIWGKHPLYKETVLRLQFKCKESNLSTKGKKHELINRLALYKGEKLPNLQKIDTNLKTVPSTLSRIKSLSIYHLKSILRVHNVTIHGTKSELVMRVFC